MVWKLSNQLDLEVQNDASFRSYLIYYSIIKKCKQIFRQVFQEKEFGKNIVTSHSALYDFFLIFQSNASAAGSTDAVSNARRSAEVVTDWFLRWHEADHDCQRSRTHQLQLHLNGIDLTLVSSVKNFRILASQPVKYNFSKWSDFYCAATRWRQFTSSEFPPVDIGFV